MGQDMKNILLATTCVAAMLGGAATAFGQAADPEKQADEKDQGGYELQEIIVTATRRSQKLQDIPLSVTAFTQEKLTKAGIIGYEGLAHNTPGIVVNKASQNFNNFTARGIGTNGYGAGLQSTVAIYIDELPISANGNSTILDPSLYDVERVEFLRGPQGTLFGSGSLAGAVRILTKKPDLNEFGASGLVDWALTGSDSFRQRYNVMVNTPLIDDKLALRIVGFYRNEDGYVDNLGTGIENSNKLVSWGGRATLLWEPNEKMSLKLLISHEDSEPEDSSLVDPELERNQRFSVKPDVFAGDLTSYNATFEYQFDGAHLTSSSTYSRYDQLFIVDLAGTTGGAVPYFLEALAYDEIFVEEARLVSDPGGKIDWVVGGFYFAKRRDVDSTSLTTDPYLGFLGYSGLTDAIFGSSLAHAKQHELAGFGELTYHVSDNFWVTGGLRYGSTDVQGFAEEGGFGSNFFFLLGNGIFGVPITTTPIAAASGVKVKASRLSYKASVSYKPLDNITTYATVSTGFRAPVVNRRAGVSQNDATDLIIPDGAGSDTLTNYEVGLKGRWLDGKLTANLAAYLIDWKNIQIQANRVSDAAQFVTNIDAAQSKGFEFEIAAIPVEGLTINLNGSFNDAQVTSITEQQAATSGAVDDARLASPHFQGTAIITYSFDIGMESKGFVSGRVSHVGSFPNQFPNKAGEPEVPAVTFDPTDAFSTVHLSAGVNNDTWSVIAYVENLFDDHSFAYVHPEVFIANRYATLRPRTIGLRVNLNY